MADQVCTLAEVKARLDIADTDHDAIITTIIEDVTSEMQTFTGRKLVPEAGATYVVDTALGHTIAVPRGIRTVTALGIAHTDQPDAGGVYTNVTLADVLLRPSPADRRPGWPATVIVLKSGPIDVRIPLRTAANGASIAGDWGFNPVLGSVHRIGPNASIAEFLDRRQTGRAGSEDVDLARLIGTDELAALARLRPGFGIGIG